MRRVLYVALMFVVVAFGPGARHVSAEPGRVEIQPVEVNREKGTVTLTIEQLKLIVEMNNAAVEEAERLRAQTGCT